MVLRVHSSTVAVAIQGRTPSIGSIRIESSINTKHWKGVSLCHSGLLGRCPLKACFATQAYSMYSPGAPHHPNVNELYTMVMGHSEPKAAPGKSAANSLESGVRTGTHLKASLTSFLLNSTGTPGNFCFHHRMALATSACFGWSAGGCLSLLHVLLMGVASHMMRPLSDTVLSGNILGTLAIGTEMTPCRRWPPWSKQIKALPLAASSQSWAAASSRWSLRLGWGEHRILSVPSFVEWALIPSTAFLLAFSNSPSSTNPSKKVPWSCWKWSPWFSTQVLLRTLHASSQPPAVPRSAAFLKRAWLKASSFRNCRYFWHARWAFSPGNFSPELIPWIDGGGLPAFWGVGTMAGGRARSAPRPPCLLGSLPARKSGFLLPPPLPWKRRIVKQGESHLRQS